jgi:hypothetical protein
MFYHASEKQGLKFLDPQQTKSTHLKASKPYVYVTDDKSYAAGFCFPWSNNEGFRFGSESETGSDWTIKIPRKYMDRLKKPASIYIITDGGFRKVYGVDTPEYYKNGRVNLAKEERYRTAMECLKKNNVNIQIIDNVKENTFIKLVELYQDILEQDLPYYVGPSDIHGKGLHARKKFNKDEVIGRAAGPVLSDKPIVVSSMGKMINHSWTPNCHINLNTANNEPFYDLTASQDIDPDEELTVDYRKYDEFKNPSPDWS